MENANETKKDPADTEGIPALPCNKLADNPLRFPFYSETHIGELAGSIKEVGLLEPVLVGCDRIFGVDSRHRLCSA